MKISRLIGVILYAIFGLYFLNYPFQIISIPSFISNFDSWIIFIGGILVLIGAFNYFRVSRAVY